MNIAFYRTCSTEHLISLISDVLITERTHPALEELTKRVERAARHNNVWWLDGSSGRDVRKELEREIDDLTNENDSLRYENEDLSNENEDLREELETLRKQIEQLNDIATKKC